MKLFKNNTNLKAALFCFLIVFSINIVTVCFGEDNTSQEYDKLLDEIFEDASVDDAIDEVFGENRLSIRDAISRLLSGDGTVIDILSELIQGRFKGISGYKELFIKLLILAIICALFGFLPQIFGNEQTSLIGHFVSFIVLVAFILSIFTDAVTIVRDTIDVIVYLMNAIIPVYLISISLTGSFATAGLSYEVFGIIIYFAQKIIQNLILPAVLIYLVTGVANELLESDKFSKLTNLIKKGISWSLKGFLTLLIGFQMLQGLITPYVDKFNTSVTKKTIESIPGVGDITSSGIEIAVGAALLVKNSVGVAGMVILMAAVFAPFIELSGYAAVLLIVNTLLQPVLQARIQKILDIAVTAVKLLVQILLTVLLLFIISVALIAAKSGGGL